MSYPKNIILNPQICKVEITPVSWVILVNIASNPFYRDVFFKSDGSDWNLIYSTLGKIVFEEEQQEDPAGPFFNQKLEFPYPGEDYSTRINLDNLENQRYLVAITYNSGIRKLLGDLENPCTLKLGFSIEKGGRIITFQRRSIEPAFLM